MEKIERVVLVIIVVLIGIVLLPLDIIVNIALSICSYIGGAVYASTGNDSILRKLADGYAATADFCRNMPPLD